MATQIYLLWYELEEKNCGLCNYLFLPPKIISFRGEVRMGFWRFYFGMACWKHMLDNRRQGR